MAIGKLTVIEFLALADEHIVLDVRSPGEFDHAHIPGARSLPLFTDEERKTVGTAYKQESQQKAIKLGLDFFSKKMVPMVEEVEAIMHSMPNLTRNGSTPLTSKTILVHCWRGGMRSAGVAWLLDLYGFKVYTLAGGYKMYRKWVLQQFEKQYPVHLVGGYTGSGKTEVLQALCKKNQLVIDLEALACHKGSAFGNLGMPQQPSQEMFENLLARDLTSAESLLQLKSTSHDNTPKVIWLEDESQRIGNVNIPAVFFKMMRTKKLFFLNIPFEKRLDFIVNHYGGFEKEKLVNAVIRIKKRLGGLETKTAVNHLIEDDIRSAFSVLLHYYDKLYLKSLQSYREDFSAVFNKLEAQRVADDENAGLLLSLVEEDSLSA